MRALALAFVLLAPLAHAQGADSSYAAMVAQLRAGDTSVDFGEMRMTYAETDAYSPYAVEPKERLGRLFQAFFDDEDLELALAIADSTLSDLYIDIDAHMIAGIAHERLGNEAEATFHFTVANGLAGSILASGEGLTPESPYVVISTAEEYAMLRLSGLQSRGQALTTCGRAACDQLTVEDPETGETFEVYFDVSRPMGWMSRELNGE
jgi:hypothetical protein